jgi:hypothetical protein
MKRTIKIQVEEAVCKEIHRLQLAGCKFLRFKDLKFETDDYIIKGHSPYYVDGWSTYEIRLAWNYLRKNFPYDKYFVVEHNGNAKFFKITNPAVERMLIIRDILK